MGLGPTGRKIVMKPWGNKKPYPGYAGRPGYGIVAFNNDMKKLFLLFYKWPAEQCLAILDAQVIHALGQCTGIEIH